MKKYLEKLKNLSSRTFTLICLGITLLISLSIILLLILPSTSSWGKAKGEVTVAQGKLDKVKADIANLNSQDPGLLKDFKALVDTLVPDKIDMLHFTTLNEVVAQASGVTITNIAIAKTAPKTPAPAVTTPTTKTTTPTTPTTQTSQVAATSLKITYQSSFSSLITLINNWKLADQIVGIIDITIASVDPPTGLLTYTVSYDLPIASSVTSKPSGEFTLTDQEKQLLEKLDKDIIFTATPSAVPNGKENPFQ